jgi:hypothetical protein
MSVFRNHSLVRWRPAMSSHVTQRHEKCSAFAAQSTVPKRQPQSAGGTICGAFASHLRSPGGMFNAHLMRLDAHGPNH